MNTKNIDQLSIIQLMETPFSTGDINVNFSQNIITRANKTDVLQPKVLELLLLLCCAQGKTLSKQELIEALWPNIVVGPDSLANCMTRLRKALNDDAKNPQFIETIQRKGYRWLKPVKLSESSLSWINQWPFKSKHYAILLVFFLSIALSFPSLLSKSAQEDFLFPDLSIKKLPDGGYEIEAGIEGKLTEEKKAAMLKEIKRITGEENSGMEFTIDPLKTNCNDTKKKTKTECDAYQSTNK